MAKNGKNVLLKTKKPFLLAYTVCTPLVDTITHGAKVCLSVEPTEQSPLSKVQFLFPRENTFNTTAEYTSQKSGYQYFCTQSRMSGGNTCKTTGKCFLFNAFFGNKHIFSDISLRISHRLCCCLSQAPDLPDQDKIYYLAYSRQNTPETIHLALMKSNYKMKTHLQVGDGLYCL